MLLLGCCYHCHVNTHTHSELMCWGYWKPDACFLSCVYFTWDWRVNRYIIYLFYLFCRVEMSAGFNLKRVGTYMCMALVTCCDQCVPLCVERGPEVWVALPVAITVDHPAIWKKNTRPRARRLRSVSGIIISGFYVLRGKGWLHRGGTYMPAGTRKLLR